MGMTDEEFVEQCRDIYDRHGEGLIFEEDEPDSGRTRVTMRIHSPEERKGMRLESVYFSEHQVVSITLFCDDDGSETSFNVSVPRFWFALTSLVKALVYDTSKL